MKKTGFAIVTAAVMAGMMTTSAFAGSLTVGTMPLSMGVPVIYAQENGFFEEAGVDVKVELFATGAPINEAIAANELDVAVSGFASVYSLANADCSWLADVNTTGGMALFARADSEIAQCEESDGMIGSKEALEGLQILEPLGTAVQYMTESYAANYGLEPFDINQVNMEFAAAYQAFITGEGDIVAANPPYSYQLEEAGYVKLTTFEAATKVNMCDGCFARNAVLEEKGEDVQKFIDCLVRAMDDLQDKDLRLEYTKKVYEDNAIETSEDAILHEIEDRLYVGSEYMAQEGYVLGEAWVAITDFLVTAEKIMADNAGNVAESINPTFVSQTTGMEIQG